MYLSLTKLLLHENISLKRLMGFDVKKSKLKAILIGLAIIYALIAFLGAFGYMFFDLGKILSQMNQGEILISFLSVYLIGMCIFMTLFRASGFLFYSKDYEILSPLPIKPFTVLCARMTVLWIMLLTSSIIFTLPIMFSYLYWNNVSVVGIINLFIGFLFIPLVPMAFVSFMSLIISTLTAKLRYAKIFQIVLIFLVMIGFFMVSFSINEVEQNPLTGQIDLFKGIASIYFPLDWFRVAVHQGSILNLLYLVLSHSIIFGLYLVFVQNIVHKTNQKGIRSASYGHKKISYEQKPLMTSLIQKEAKRFFSSIIYATNTGFGPIILLVAAIASIFFKTQLESILGDAVGASLPLDVMIIGLIGFTVALTYTPAISLSLEGKNFWIIKSLPIPPKKVIYSKIVFNLLLSLPVAYLSIILFGFSLAINIVTQLVMILLVTTFGILISCFDASINLLMPKFNFVNDMEVVKQSVGALMAIFGGLMFMAINGVIYYFLNQEISIILTYMIMAFANIILIIPIIYFLEKKIEPIFVKLSA